MHNVLINFAGSIAIIAGVSLIIAFLEFAKKKAEEIEDIRLKKASKKLIDIIEKAVACTNQTFVNGLKEAGGFTIEAQEQARNNAKNAIEKMLDKESYEILNDAYENLNTYINTALEAEVLKQKELSNKREENGK